MPSFQTYNVTPILPATLEPLRDLSFNLWWTWEPGARRLFRELDPELWNETNHNPVRMLQLARQSRLEELAQDKNFLRELKQVFQDFEKYLGRHNTYGKTGPGAVIKSPIAYFSAEFGFHESIPNYSGGLGILAGDHCKSASDLDLNFVAMGLLYRHGYFREQIDKDGIQAAINLNQNFYHLPIREVRRGEAKLLISVPILGREVFARVWELRVGRVNVYLLDTDVPENSPEDRRITAELYGGDLEMRMRQEIVPRDRWSESSRGAWNPTGCVSHERRALSLSRVGADPAKCGRKENSTFIRRCKLSRPLMFLRLTLQFPPAMTRSRAR